MPSYPYRVLEGFSELRIGQGVELQWKMQFGSPFGWWFGHLEELHIDPDRKTALATVTFRPPGSRAVSRLGGLRRRSVSSERRGSGGAAHGCSICGIRVPSGGGGSLAKVRSEAPECPPFRGMGRSGL